jgi:hypothetical protein
MRRLVAIAVVVLAGCATPRGGSVTGSNAGDQAAVGAGIGAVAGYALCKAMGRSDVACRHLALAGAAAGGYLGWQRGKQQDLAEARALEQELRQARLPVRTTTASARRLDDAGQPRTMEAWAATDVQLPPMLLAARDPQLQQTMRKVGEFAAKRSEPTVIIVRADPSDQNEVVAWINQGLASVPGGQRPQIRALARGPGESPQVTVGPADRRQFALA